MTVYTFVDIYHIVAEPLIKKYEIKKKMCSLSKCEKKNAAFGSIVIRKTPFMWRKQAWPVCATTGFWLVTIFGCGSHPVTVYNIVLTLCTKGLHTKRL